MQSTESRIAEAYAAFNRHDSEGMLALMSDDVSGPRASEGGVVVGKQEIRAYGSRQWQQFDPRVERIAITAGDGGEVKVEVHQRVKSLVGELLSDSVVWHIYTVSAGLFTSMRLGDGSDGAAPSAAFARH